MASVEAAQKSNEAIETDESSDELNIPEYLLKSSRKKPIVNPVDEVFEGMLADMEKEQWYHGCLPFEDIVGLLKKNGDFLIRELEPEGDGIAAACVTVKWDDKIRNQQVFYSHCGKDRIFTLDGRNKRNDIMSIVKFHYTTKTPINEGIILENPIAKQPWELTSDKITVQTKIGAGAFGEVFEGTLSQGPNKPPLKVAIKVTKVNDQNKAKIDEMYKEARLMRQYKHKNVVTFHGIVIKSAENAMVVMELVNGGGLHVYLKKNKNVPMKTKVGYATDLAVGLVYLHSKGCMHRDVACRNCLLDIKNNIVKITDFGLSKQGESYKIPDDEPLPIRWQAPEVIKTRIYTAKCDVYSYAITVWEIFHNAETPFTDIDNKTIKEKISDPKFRPPVETSLPIVIQRVIKACWRGNRKKRPVMSQAARYLLNAPPELLEPGFAGRKAKTVTASASKTRAKSSTKSPGGASSSEELSRNRQSRRRRASAQFRKIRTV